MAVRFLNYLTLLDVQSFFLYWMLIYLQYNFQVIVHVELQIKTSYTKHIE